MLARTAALCLVVALAPACATPTHGFAEGRTSCAEDDPALLFCDADGRLVTCAGRTPVVATDGIHACVVVDGAGYLVTCPSTGGPAPAELVPCPTCDEAGRTPTFVAFAADQCVLPKGRVLPSLQAAAPADDDDGAHADVDGPAPDILDDDAERAPQVAGQSYEACPCAAGLVCHADLGVCVEPVLCDPFADSPCPEGEACRFDAELPYCAPVDDDAGVDGGAAASGAT